MNNFFASNRERLITKLEGNLVVISAYATMQRGNDLVAPFEQEANFWWLTGIEEPDWWLIIDGMRGKSWLVAPKRHAAHPINRDKSDSDDEHVRSVSGVDDILTFDAGMHKLRELAKKHSIVRTLGEQPHSDYLNFSLNPAPRKTYEMLDRIFNTVQDCRRELASLRARKQPEEIARIRKVVNLTIAAFEQVKASMPEMKYEYQLEAEFGYYFRNHGAKSCSSDMIIAAGANASDLRYHANASKLKKRETILIEAGARYNGYVGDIARTYAYGEPTQRQRAIHTGLCQARSRIIKLLGPNLAVDEYQRNVDTIMQDMLIELGLISGRSDIAAYRRYFPHAISHGVGVDVHDSLSAPHFFQPGMALTVEPGVYIPEEGIGMRLEDIILITPTGNSNLSARLSTDL